jgi:hypothetical protein
MAAAREIGTLERTEIWMGTNGTWSLDWVLLERLVDDNVVKLILRDAV